VPVRPEDLRAAVWRESVKIRFGHCDPAGIVYTPVYFDLFNAAVEDWFAEALGHDYHAIVRDDRIGLGYGHASADFLAPCFMGDVVEIAVVVARIGRASIELTMHMFNRGSEAARGRLVVVTTSLAEHRAVPIPPAIREALEAYRSRCA
jgi:4-hydroxybenzoyl-CoA thioesterase/acyl-CoA thioester hydrolase